MGDEGLSSKWSFLESGVYNVVVSIDGQFVRRKLFGFRIGIIS